MRFAALYFELQTELIQRLDRDDEVLSRKVGYAHFFLYLLVVAAVFWVAGAKLVADRVSEWAWCALMISALLYTWRACRLPESDETSSL